MSDYFNPRPSCEGRLLHVIANKDIAVFQSPSLVRGTTCTASIFACALSSFQSPSLVRGTTGISACALTPAHYFNPRPSCEGRRRRDGRVARIYRNFNPRPSCEGRQSRTARQRIRESFQSPSLVRGTTRQKKKCISGRLFQSPSLVRGTTGVACINPSRRIYFNPRPSCEGRLISFSLRHLYLLHFNPRPSCEGRLLQAFRHVDRKSISIPVPRARDDPTSGSG